MHEYKREKYEREALLLLQFSGGMKAESSQALLKSSRCCEVLYSHGRGRCDHQLDAAESGLQQTGCRTALGPSQEGSFVLSPLPHITQGSGHLGPRTHSSAFIPSQPGLVSYLHPYILLPPS